jgi:hypothetical protein
LGVILGSVVNSLTTGVLCQVVQFQPEQKNYILKDLEEAETIQVSADLVGPTDYLNRKGQLVRSKPNQPWKILQGAELMRCGFIDKECCTSIPFSGSVCFFPYGQGPFTRGEIVQKHENNKPTGIFCRIVEVVFPPGKQPATDGENDDDGGDFGKDISLDELKAYSYVLQPCPRGRLHEPIFTVDVSDAHDESKWKIVK